MTDAFFEAASRTGLDLGALAAPRLASSATDSLDDVTFVDGSTALFQHQGGAVLRLDDATNQFTLAAPGADPFTRLPLVDADGLRLRFTRVGAQVTKELRLDNLGGASSWVPFSLTPQRQFPFDMVTALAAASNGELLVGTKAGLEIYGGARPGLSNLRRLLTMTTPPFGPLTEVRRAGQYRSRRRSADGPLGQHAASSGGGAEPSHPARDAALLDSRLRVRNDFWQWTWDAAGKLTGRYYDNQHQLSPTPSASAAVALAPHDQITDAAVCSGAAFTQWKTGWISVYPTAALSLASGVLNYPRAATDPQRLVCLPRDISCPRAPPKPDCTMRAAEARFTAMHPPVGAKLPAIRHAPRWPSGRAAPPCCTTTACVCCPPLRDRVSTLSSARLAASGPRSAGTRHRDG